MRIRFLSAVATAFASNLAGQVRELPVAWEFPMPGRLPQALLKDRAGRPLLYVAAKNGGFVILDLTDPTRPRARGALPVSRLGGLDAMHLTQQGSLVYLALGDLFKAAGAPAGLAIVDVADPDRPRVHGLWKSAGVMQGAAAVLVDGQQAYLGAMSHGVIVLDVSNPASPREITRVLPDPNYPRRNPNKVQRPNARGLALAGSRLYVAFDAGGLRVLDVSNPSSPREVGRYLNPALLKRQQAYNGLAIDGRTAFVGVDYAGLEVLDVSDPGAIRQVAWWNPWRAETAANTWFNSPGHVNQVEYLPGRQRVVASAGDSELLVLDVVDRAHPTLVERVGAPKDGRGSWGVTTDGDRSYLSYITAIVPFRGTWAGIRSVVH